MNRAYYLFERDAHLMIPKLVPMYAHRADVKKDVSGYWINVQWKAGITAPLTYQEELQAKGEEKC